MIKAFIQNRKITYYNEVEMTYLPILPIGGREQGSV